MTRHVLPIFLLLGIIVLGMVEPVSARSKTDVIVLRNGDRITCEIKSMSVGKITVSTDSMGKIDIEWLDVVSVKSDYYFRVEASNGKRYYGILELLQESSVLKITSMGAVVALERVNVVEITPISQSFWEKIDGSLSVGFNYTRASNVAQFTFGWSNRYVGERNMFDLDASSAMTDKSDSTGVAKKVDLSFSYVRLLKKKWTGNTNLTISRNDELALQRRYLLSLSSGVSLVKNNHDVLLFSAGFAGNLETSTNGNETNSLEALFSGSFSRFNYNTPKTNIKIELDFYPSLTERGRYRYSADATLSREIVSDLFFNLSFYNDYDSQGAAGAGQERDYGIDTSISWSY